MPKDKSRLQIKLEYFAARALLGAFGLLPLRASMSAGAWFGRLFGQLAAKRLRRVGMRNLEIAFPEADEAQRRKILRGCFESLGRQLGLVSRLPRLSLENLPEIISVEGIEHCAAAYATGRGVLFFTAHFGGWEAAHFPISAAGFPINIIIRQIDNPLIEAFVNNLRTRFGARTIDKKKSARGMFRLLKSGEIVGVLADLNMQEHEGVFVDFFGVPASTTVAVAKLALRSNAVVLPFFAVWRPERRKYVLQIEPPVQFNPTGDDEADTRELTQQVTKIIEDYARRYPDQWFWIHKRWNTRPEGEKLLY